jgi:hypothetical protein
LQASSVPVVFGRHVLSHAAARTVGIGSGTLPYYFLDVSRLDHQLFMTRMGNGKVSFR